MPEPDQDPGSQWATVSSDNEFKTLPPYHQRRVAEAFVNRTFSDLQPPDRLHVVNALQARYPDDAGISTQRLQSLTLQYAGTPYKYGGENTNGLDCSAFTQQVMRKMGASIPRTARDQFKSGKGDTVPLQAAQIGDLVYFKGTSDKVGPEDASHVGIYSGDGKFIHMSSAKGGLARSNINDPFWQQHLLGVKRFMTTSPTGQSDYLPSESGTSSPPSPQDSFRQVLSPSQNGAQPVPSTLGPLAIKRGNGQPGPLGFINAPRKPQQSIELEGPYDQTSANIASIRQEGQKGVSPLGIITAPGELTKAAVGDMVDKIAGKPGTWTAAEKGSIPARIATTLIGIGVDPTTYLGGAGAAKGLKALFEGLVAKGVSEKVAGVVVKSVVSSAALPPAYNAAKAYSEGNTDEAATNAVLAGLFATAPWVAPKIVSALSRIKRPLAPDEVSALRKAVDPEGFTTPEGKLEAQALYERFQSPEANLRKLAKEADEVWLREASRLGKQSPPGAQRLIPPPKVVSTVLEDGTVEHFEPTHTVADAGRNPVPVMEHVGPRGGKTYTDETGSIVPVTRARQPVPMGESHASMAELSRPYSDAGNTGTAVFPDTWHRDLHDLGAEIIGSKMGENGKELSPKGLSLSEGLTKSTGLSHTEVQSKALETFFDITGQMRGIGKGETRRVEPLQRPQEGQNLSTEQLYTSHPDEGLTGLEGRPRSDVGYVKDFPEGTPPEEILKQANVELENAMETVRSKGLEYGRVPLYAADLHFREALEHFRRSFVEGQSWGEAQLDYHPDAQGADYAKFSKAVDSLRHNTGAVYEAMNALSKKYGPDWRYMARPEDTKPFFDALSGIREAREALPSTMKKPVARITGNIVHLNESGLRALAASEVGGFSYNDELPSFAGVNIPAEGVADTQWRLRGAINDPPKGTTRGDLQAVYDAIRKASDDGYGGEGGVSLVARNHPDPAGTLHEEAMHGDIRKAQMPIEVLKAVIEHPTSDKIQAAIVPFYRQEGMMTQIEEAVTHLAHGPTWATVDPDGPKLTVDEYVSLMQAIIEAGKGSKFESVARKYYDKRIKRLGRGGDGEPGGDVRGARTGRSVGTSEENPGDVAGTRFSSTRKGLPDNPSVWTGERLEELKPREKLVKGRIGRLVNRKEGVGAPKNPRTVLHDDKGNSLVVGDVTPDDVIARINSLQPNELEDARNWYPSVWPTFREIYGNDHDALNALVSWGVSQVQASPARGLTNSLASGDEIRGFPHRQQTATGMTKAAIEQALKGQPPTGGLGPKIWDFLDAIFGKDTRSIMGGDPRGGAPAPVDTWAFFGGGYVDNSRVFTIEEKTGHLFQQDAFSLDGTTHEAAYERVAKLYRDTAEKLGWRPDEVQAADWFAVRKFFGHAPVSPSDMVLANTHSVSYDLGFPEGSPYAKDYPQVYDLPYSEAAKITGQVVPKTAEELADLIGAHLTGSKVTPGVYEDFPATPSGKLEVVATPETAQAFADGLQYLAQQKQVFLVREKSGGRNSVLDIQAELPGRAGLQDIWGEISNATGLKGAQGIPGGFRIINTDGKWTGKQAAELSRKIDGILEAHGVDIDQVATHLWHGDLIAPEHDWEADPNGNSILQRFAASVGAEKTQELAGRLRDRFKERLDQAFGHRGPGEGKELQADVPGGAGVLGWRESQGTAESLRAAVERYSKPSPAPADGPTYLWPDGSFSARLTGQTHERVAAQALKTAGLASETPLQTFQEKAQAIRVQRSGDRFSVDVKSRPTPHQMDAIEDWAKVYGDFTYYLSAGGIKGYGHSIAELHRDLNNARYSRIGPQASVPRNRLLPPHEAAVEERLARRVEAGPEHIVHEYIRRNGNNIDADQARELSPEYNATVESRGNYAFAVQNPASKITELVFQHYLNSPTPPGKSREFLLVSGGPGSGKSVMSTASSEGSTPNHEVLFQKTFSNFDKASRDIDAILASGRTVKMVYVNRDPLESLGVKPGADGDYHGALQRAEDDGRTVNLDFFAFAHSESPKVFGRLYEKYKNDPRVTFKAATNAGYGDIKPLEPSEVANVGLDRERIQREGREGIDRLYSEGKLSKRVYDLVLKSSERRNAGVDGAESEGTPGTEAQGQGLEEPGEIPRRVTWQEVDKRNTDLQQAMEKLKAGELTASEYDALVDSTKPVTEYRSVPDPASHAGMESALDEDLRPMLGVPSKLPAGAPVGLRLHIPAYTGHGEWIVSVHEPKVGEHNAGQVGNRIGFESVARVTDPSFSVNEKAAMSVASGKPKASLATMEGNWVPTTPEEAKAFADEKLHDPEWTQVGMDPERHAYFYDRGTMEPVESADEAVQVGGLILAKNVKYAPKSDFRYSRTGPDAGFDPYKGRGHAQGGGTTPPPPPAKPVMTPDDLPPDPHNWQPPTPGPQSPLLTKAGHAAMEVLGLQRALRTAFDVSGTARQGAVLGAAHPALAAKAFGKQIEAILSKKTYADITKEIEASPHFDLGQKAGLAITRIHGELGDLEEAFQTNYGDYIPGIYASERGYVTYLNWLRQAAFDANVEHMISTGKSPYSGNLFGGGDIPEESLKPFQQLAGVINAMSGRGNLPKALEPYAPAMNQVLFSTRFQASRVELLSMWLNPKTYTRLDPQARKLAARGMVSLISGIAILNFMAHQAGLETEVNPLSTSFGHVKWGNLEFDFSAGLQPWIVRFARWITGEQKTPTGIKPLAEPHMEKMPLSTGDMKVQTESDLAARARGVGHSALDFMHGKMAPVPSEGLSYLRGQYPSQPSPPFPAPDASSTLSNMFVPMIVNDVLDGLQEHGAAGALATGAAAELGVSVQRRTPPPFKMKPPKKANLSGGYGSLGQKKGSLSGLR